MRLLNFFSSKNSLLPGLEVRQWLEAGVGSHFQVESAFTLQRHRVQIIQIFCLLVKLKETKPNRGRTSLLPER